MAETRAGVRAADRGVAGGWVALGAAGGAVAVWSTNAVAAGAALQELTVAQVLALQFAAATTLLAITRALEDPKRPTGDESRPRLTGRAATVSVVGLAGTIALQYLAFATAPLVAANAIAYAWPLVPGPPGRPWHPAAADRGLRCSWRWWASPAW